MADLIQCLFVIPIIGTYPHPVDPENPTTEEQEAIDAWQARYDNAWGLYGKLERNYDRILVVSHDYIDLFYPDQGVEVSHPASPGVNGNAVWFPTAWLGRPSDSATIADKAAWFAGKIADLRAAPTEYIIRGWATEHAHTELTSRNYTIVTEG